MSLLVDAKEGLEGLSAEQLVKHLTALGWSAEGERSELKSRLELAILQQSVETGQLSRNKTRCFSFVNACCTGDLELIHLCLKYGVDVNTTFKGLSGLHKAALKGQVDAVRLLLSKGAKVDMRYIKQRNIFSCVSSNPLDTAMHLAAQQFIKTLRKSRGVGKTDMRVLSPHQQVMVLLLEAGGRLDLKNKQGYTPLDILGSRGDFLISAADRWRRWQLRRAMVLMLHGCSLLSLTSANLRQSTAGRGMVSVLLNPDLALEIMRFYS